MQHIMLYSHTSRWQTDAYALVVQMHCELYVTIPYDIVYYTVCIQSLLYTVVRYTNQFNVFLELSSIVNTQQTVPNLELVWNMQLALNSEIYNI